MDPNTGSEANYAGLGSSHFTFLFLKGKEFEWSLGLSPVLPCWDSHGSTHLKHYILIWKVPIIAFPHQSLIQMDQNFTNENASCFHSRLCHLWGSNCPPFPSPTCVARTLWLHTQSPTGGNLLSPSLVKRQKQKPNWNSSSRYFVLEKIPNSTYIRDAP